MFDQHNPAPSHKLHYNLYARSTMMMKTMMMSTMMMRTMMMRTMMMRTMMRSTKMMTRRRSFVELESPCKDAMGPQESFWGQTVFRGH